MTPAAPGAAMTTRRVEHVDIDGYGIVHFSRYAAFVETAALETLERWGASLRELERRGLELRVRELRLSYAAPARYGDALRLETEVAHVGEARLRLATRVWRRGDVEDESLVAGYLELVFTDRSTGAPVPIPEDLRCLLTDTIT